MRTRCSSLLTLALFAAVLGLVSAHEHHDEPDGPYEHNFTNEEPMDNLLKWHIAIQVFVWGLLFPVGMILGLTHSRWHVPLQTVGILLTLLPGNLLGHHHGGRSFHSTAHSHASTYLWWYLILQTACGVFLKLHLREGTRLRSSVLIAHGIIGKSFPVFGWVQMIFGGIAALGFCFGEHFGQWCVHSAGWNASQPNQIMSNLTHLSRSLAHFIMGSSFIAYAFIMLIMLRVGADWLARRKCSQEFLDSWVIMVWGIVNTFTEHDFLRSSGYWSHKDMQHVSLGLLWWCGGFLGIVLGRKKRNVVPGLIIVFTGVAMSAHEQSTVFSTKVHTLFGFALVAAGIARIIEICFVMNDAPADSSHPRAFQHLPPFFLVLSGLTFLSATEEQVHWIAGEVGMDAATYGNILFSGAFVIYGVGVVMIELYERLARGDDAKAGGDEENPEMRQQYESVPMTSRRDSEAIGMGPNRSVFDLGEDEDEDLPSGGAVGRSGERLAA